MSRILWDYLQKKNKGKDAEDTREQNCTLEDKRSSRKD